MTNYSECSFKTFKGVADVAEAIIGAAYITAGREVALRVTKAMNIPVPHIDRWTDFARKTLAPPPDVSAPLKPGTVEHIEEAIGHRFKRPHLLAQALVSLSQASRSLLRIMTFCRHMRLFKAMRQRAMNDWNLLVTLFLISVCHRHSFNLNADANLLKW
jgi:hypothetical protein